MNDPKTISAIEEAIKEGTLEFPPRCFNENDLECLNLDKDEKRMCGQEFRCTLFNLMMADENG